VAAEPRGYFQLRLSPDGRRVALDVRDQDLDTWIWDFEARTLSRLTFDPSIDSYPVWTPDGKYLLTTSGPGIVRQTADGGGVRETLVKEAPQLAPMAVSPDGESLVFRQTTPKGGMDLRVLALGRPGGPAWPGDARDLIATPHSEVNADVSPDGSWLAYQSTESGRDEIYVRPFPDVEKGRWQVSSGGGTRPLWARSGRELFYLTADGRLMAVPVQTRPTFASGRVEPVLDRLYFVNAPGLAYAASPDGKRFLMIKDESLLQSKAPQLVVVQNWFEELKRLVPPR
jgi:serine/threonine-protein kinase